MEFWDYSYKGCVQLNDKNGGLRLIMKKAMAIMGDLWHAAGYIDLAIVKKLEAKDYQVDKILDNEIPYEDLSTYDLIIISRYGYDDCENFKNNNPVEKKYWATENQEKCFEEYVINGGKILLHHDAFVYRKKGNGICNLAKAVFINHPIIQKINVKPVGETVGLNAGINAYQIEEEEYFLEDMDERKTNVFLECYSEENGRHLLGWHHTYGDGKVVVYIPGHNMSVFQHPMVDRGLQNVIDYLICEE
jgi:uncharacterized membrane protein